MVVAVSFEHVVSPVVEIAPVSAGDANGAFNAKLSSTSVLVYVVDLFAFNAKLLSIYVLV